MYRINFYWNLESPEKPKTISIDDYVDYIQNGFNEKDVLKARLFEKGSEPYNNIKENRFCVTHNFRFDGHRCDSKIKSSTGLIYFDIDEKFSIDSLDKSKLFIHHKSFGGVGDTVIVKVSGVTVENFRETYYDIANKLGISQCMDLSAIKKTQSTVLSYDPNIYFNPDSYVFTATKKLSYSGNMSSASNLPANDSFPPKNLGLKSLFRLTNASDFVDSDKLYQVFPEGLMTAKIDIPRNIPIGKRNSVLIAIANQIVSLNPYLTQDQALDKIVGVNNIFANEPLPYNEVLGIVRSIFKYKENKSLKPILNKARKVIFHENCTLSKNEKIGVVNTEVGRMRVAKTKQLIYDAIIELDGLEKITAKKVATKIGRGIATVNRYWPEFKILIKELNSKISKENTK